MTNFKAIVKEILRLAIFSLPGALILVFTANPTLAGAYGVPILYILRAIDKGIHEDKTVEAKGLLPF